MHQLSMLCFIWTFNTFDCINHDSVAVLLRLFFQSIRQPDLNVRQEIAFILSPGTQFSAASGKYSPTVIACLLDLIQIQFDFLILVVKVFHVLMIS